jgi:hypothetical protein
MMNLDISKFLKINESQIKLAKEGLYSNSIYPARPSFQLLDIGKDKRV